MARYVEARCRLCRREGQKLFLKADRCNTDKCALEKRQYAPGQHGQGRGKRSDYGVQLREKQKVKRYYGLVERQFRFLFSKADRMKGVTGENLLQLLERRLDNVVFRMGFASSRSEARQMVLHGHFAVNGRKVAVPSFCVKAGMEVAVREVRKDHKLLAARAEAGVGREPPKWLEVNLKEMKGKVVAMPAREDIDLPIQENLIVELYSK